MDLQLRFLSRPVFGLCLSACAYQMGVPLLPANLNISEFGVRQTEIEAAMAPAVAPALPCFQRVWILWKALLYGPWSA